MGFILQSDSDIGEDSFERVLFRVLSFFSARYVNQLVMVDDTLKLRRIIALCAHLLVIHNSFDGIENFEPDSKVRKN